MQESKADKKNTEKVKHDTRSLAVRAAAIYGIFGGLWVLLSDHVLALFVQDPTTVQRLQTYKGWLFILISMLFLYVFLRRGLEGQRKLQAALGESEAQLLHNLRRVSVASEAAGMGFWERDLRTDAEMWDDYMHEMYGSKATGGERTMSDWTQHIYPQDVEGMLAAEQLAVDTGTSLHKRYRIIRPDGEIRYIETHAEIERDVAGVPIRLVGVDRDVTDIVTAERTLQLQSAALSAAANAIVITDRSSVIEWVNPAFMRLTGYSEAESIGRKLGDLVRSGKQSPEFYSKMWQTILGGKVWQGEQINRRKDGSLYNEEQTVTPVLDETGEITHFVAVKQDVSERSRAQAALRESEQRYRSIFENNHSVMLLIDPATGAIVDANPAAVTYYGWTSAELRTMNISAINTRPPSDIHNQMDLARNESHTRFVFQHRRADGSVRDVEVFSGPIKREGRSLLYSIVHDITVRKQHEREVEAVAAVSAALRDSSTRSEMLPVILDQLESLFAADGTIIEFIDPLTGQLTTELARGVWAPLTGVAFPIGVGASARIVASGQAFFNNDVATEPDLLYRDLLGAATAVAGVPLVAQGEIIGVIGIASRQPITEHDLRVLVAMADIAASAIQRVTLYEQTQSQAEELAQIMRNIPDGLLLLDAHARVVTATPRAEHYLRLLADGTTGHVISRLGDHSLFSLLVPPPLGEYHRVEGAGRTFEVAARIVERKTAAKGWVLAIRDVTDELLNQQQVQRQERLAAIGQLAAGIAHDFNNIMSVITIYTQLLSTAPEISPKMRDRLQIIDQQSTRATQVIRQILDFSRRSVMQRQTFDFLPLLWEQVKLLERTLPENIQISVSHGHGPFQVHADATRLAQVIMNLSINARDAMVDGGKLSFTLSHVQDAKMNGGSGSTSTLPTADDSSWVCLTVSDSGTGIASEHLEHIFEPFFTTKAPGSGTGLGLPQVYGIVGQHGGHITVNSQPGAGTTFVIYLPFVPITPEAPSRDSEPSNIPEGSGQTVLLVEDEDALRRSMVELLGMWNYHVLEAANGRQALEILAAAQQPISLVLTDVVMPVLGGIGLLKEMRQRGLKTPVVLVTGHPLNDELEGLRKLGMIAWLNKPASTTQIAEALTLALRRQ
jgi:PAS domain S-box-containing protein